MLKNLILAGGTENVLKPATMFIGICNWKYNIAWSGEWYKNISKKKVLPKFVFYKRRQSCLQDLLRNSGKINIIEGYSKHFVF